MGALDRSAYLDARLPRSQASLRPLPLPGQDRRRLIRRLLLMALVTLSLLALATLLLAEAHTSRWQAQELSHYASTLTFALGNGPSDDLVLPDHGPFDRRLGYTRLRDIQRRLTTRGFVVARQARFSPALQDYARRGFFPPYREKTQAGLTIEECRGAPFYAFRHPRHQYADFASIPSLVVQALMFIENRELLDDDRRYANPAVDWPRFVKAAMSQVGKTLHLQDQSSGGSTLATQIEKFRHSPGGLTVSIPEKLRQMVSASVRAYRQGPETLTARQDVVLDYLNSVPLSAVPGYGEVHGLGDGLWAWFGADVTAVNRRLDEASAGEASTAARGRALRQVVALMIAQRRPSWYLREGRRSLGTLADGYLRLLFRHGVIDAALRDAALGHSLRFRDFTERPMRPNVPGAPGVGVARRRLAELLDMPYHALDRLDLSAGTTLNAPLQRAVGDYLKRLADPEFAREAGVIGHRLLSPDHTAEVHYSFTLLERGASGFRVRVQTDTDDRPFDINQHSKLELGSTAKLRVLASYLEIVAELYRRHAGQPIEALRAVEVDRQDAIQRWGLDYLIHHPDSDLTAMLEAAMQRRYSASPHERFFTGGGLHAFINFSRRDDQRRPTLEESLRRSINLPFVRLLRDQIRYLTFQGKQRRRLLEDDQDPRRALFLSLFAEREGRVFLERFWREYRPLSPQQRAPRLLDGLRQTPVRLATVYRYLWPERDPIDFATFLRQRLPGIALSDRRLATLYREYGPADHGLSDLGYLARLHPLELWLVGYLLDNPEARYEDMIAAGADERQAVYGWLYRTRHRGARDRRIRTMLEIEAFAALHRRWQRLGYPFEGLVPSLATAIGSSGDRPSALAELVGIILNDGIRHPVRRIERLHFAAGTPFETRFVSDTRGGERVMTQEVAETLRRGLSRVVEDGTARRLGDGFQTADGTALPLGGKTGTGDNRFETVTPFGQVISSRARNRTTTFVFYLGERHFGTLTAYVPGRAAEDHAFTSSLPVQILKAMEPILMAYLVEEGPLRCRPEEAAGT